MFSPLALAFVFAAAGARTAPVPAAMLGTWSDASCSAGAASRLVIGPKVAKLGTGRPMPIVFYPDDTGKGRGAIHWREEGNVDNFVYDAASKRIVHNLQGYHMPGQVVYARCSAKMH
jgi:hypothetical protein